MGGRSGHGVDVELGPVTHPWWLLCSAGGCSALQVAMCVRLLLKLEQPGGQQAGSVGEELLAVLGKQETQV